MEANLINETPPVTVTSRSPGSDKVLLGRAIQLLNDSMQAHVDEFEAAIETVDKLNSFGQANARYAKPYQLSKITSPHALKAWAAERLPSLDVSYGFSNRITREVAKQNLDEEASLKIVQFADDMIMIAKFCRDISEMNIQVDAHSHGIEFRFFIRGRSLGPQFEAAETDCFYELLHAKSRDGSFKNRIVSTDDRIEAHSVLFRKKVRLGFSPLF